MLVLQCYTNTFIKNNFFQDEKRLDQYSSIRYASYIRRWKVKCLVAAKKCWNICSSSTLLSLCGGSKGNEKDFQTLDHCIINCKHKVFIVALFKYLEMAYMSNNQKVNINSNLTAQQNTFLKCLIIKHIFIIQVMLNCILHFSHFSFLVKW